MAVNANTNQTYDVSTIREDLDAALASISPVETVFMSTIGTRNVDNTYFEWSEVDLAAAADNRAVEGDAATNSAPTNAVRKGNYTQISTKTVEVSSTNQAVNGVARVHRNLIVNVDEVHRWVPEVRLAGHRSNGRAVEQNLSGNIETLDPVHVALMSDHKNGRDRGEVLG